MKLGGGIRDRAKIGTRTTMTEREPQPERSTAAVAIPAEMLPPAAIMTTTGVTVHQEHMGLPLPVTTGAQGGVVAVAGAELGKLDPGVEEELTTGAEGGRQ